MKVRQWEPEDNDTVLSWCEDDPDLVTKMGFPEGSGPDDVHMKLLEGMIDNDTAHIAVESDGEVAALVTLVRMTGYAAPVAHIVVSPTRRGKAVWYARAAKKYLAEKGIGQVIALIPRGRQEVKRFASKLGFHAPEVDILVCDNGAGE